MVSYLKALREKNLRNRMKTWCLQSLETWESLREFQVCQMKTHSSILTWENFMDRGAWWASIHGVAKSQTQRSMHARRHRILKKKNMLKRMEGFYHFQTWMIIQIVLEIVLFFFPFPRIWFIIIISSTEFTVVDNHL